MDTCLALTIFRDDFDVIFMIYLIGLLFLRVFHWVVHDRVEFVTHIYVDGSGNGKCAL